MSYLSLFNFGIKLDFILPFSSHTIIGRRQMNGQWVVFFNTDEPEGLAIVGSERLLASGREAEFAGGYCLQKAEDLLFEGGSESKFTSLRLD